MSCITWNARGLGNSKAIHNLHRLITDEDPSLLFLCETKLVSGQCRNFKHTLGFEGCFVKDYIGRKGGLILLWKDPLKVEIKSCSSGHIDAIIDHNLRRWRFTGFYGYFNEVLYDYEKQGGRPRSLSQMKNFQEALDQYCLRNITSMGEFFTRANKQLGSDFIQERLDRYVSTLAWGQLFSNSRCQNLKFYSSDHRAIKITLGPSHVWKNLECLLDKEEIYWKQRSCTDWLTHGDRNSKFFHHKASERRRKNFIEGLKNMEGEWYTGIDNISNVVTDYFDKLFSSSNPSLLDMDTVFSCVKPKVSQSINEHLSRPFTGEEIRKALEDMPPTKSPGPDGDIHQWNQTLITLIPKIQSPTQVSEFRPISLCNVVYKLVSRTNTNRFSKILDEVIGDQQSAFVPGQLITDNVLLGFETMHWLRQHRGGNTGYAALKLDMSKAYDRVEWPFLEGMMLRLGFAESWVKLIMRCVRSVSYSFLINRQVTGSVIPNRGLRQGDPLSPYLFVICAHGLSEMLASFEERKCFIGIKIASGCPSISHLFFADDSLIFCKAKLSELTHLKSCLTSYAKASG
ncbi:hypothetical protein UlMin_026033 [Ulmus minor]